MIIEQVFWTSDKGWSASGNNKLAKTAQLIILFGTVDNFKRQNLLEDVKRMYPNGQIFGCSTAGEIYNTQVFDNSLVATAIKFEYSSFQSVQVALADVSGSFEAGKMLAQKIPHNNLVHVFVLSDGLNVNGSELVKGLTNQLPEHVKITGGLAGNGEKFEETYVIWDGIPEKNKIALIGFYGDRLKVGYGSMGGWDSFGPERLITKSKENVLYGLDGHSALEIYKRYLGENAKGLPATGLLFPLSIRTKDGESGIVRTILGIDEENNSMTFAGDIPEGAYARLMKTNFERLIDGAQGAAKISYEAIGGKSPDLAILISCVGRKLVLKQRTEEEVEVARDILGDHTALTGFYSYGEISPFAPGVKCALHNQTMTITTLIEE